MRYLLSFLFAFLTLPVFATTNSAPFLPEVNARFRTLEALPSYLGATTNGIGNARLARFKYDVAVTGGTSSASAKSLSVTLPAHALLWDGALYVDTAFTGASSVSLKCGSATFLASQTITSWTSGQIKAVVPVGTAAAAQDVGSSACDVSATVLLANTTAGKLTGWLLYFVHD